MYFTSSVLLRASWIDRSITMGDFDSDGESRSCLIFGFGLEVGIPVLEVTISMNLEPQLTHF